MRGSCAGTTSKPVKTDDATAAVFTSSMHELKSQRRWPPAKTDDGEAGLLSVEGNSDGGFTVCVSKKVWLSSGDPWMQADGRRFSATDGTLKLVRQMAISGTDIGGDFIGHRSEWTTMGTGGGDSFGSLIYHTSSRLYAATDHVVFAQSFSNGAANMSNGSDVEGLLSSYI